MWVMAALLSVMVRGALASHDYEHDLADLVSQCEFCSHAHVSPDDQVGVEPHFSGLEKPCVQLSAVHPTMCRRETTSGNARGPPPSTA